MTDVFLSYSSIDRERVRPIFEVLAAAGFDVFWDLETPAGVSWEKWIVGHLTRAKSVVVCWSRNAGESDNVKYEARVAKDHGKLIPLMLEPLTVEQFPMGLDAIQAPSLTGWSGDASDDRWQRLQKEIEIKVAPLWAKRGIHRLEASLLAERKRRESAESHEGALRLQVEQEVQKRVEIERTRDAGNKQVREDLENVRTQAEALSQLVLRLVKQIMGRTDLIKRRGEMERGTVTFVNKTHDVALIVPQNGGSDIVVAIYDDEDDDSYFGYSVGERAEYFHKAGIEGVGIAASSQPSV